MRSSFAISIGLFTALPLVVFILAAVTQLTLYIFALQAESFKSTGIIAIIFQSIRPLRLQRDNLLNHNSINLLDKQL
ncbi:hypothetical protein WAI453_006413 [Rhynchosporium graminicola]